MAKPRAFKVGDIVRIVNPQFVVRVGYPLSWSMLDREVRDNPRFAEAMAIFGIGGEALPDTVESVGGLFGKHRGSPCEKSMREFAEGVQRALCRYRNFGGSERSIHTETIEEMEFGPNYKEAEIISRRVVKTGKYYPPGGGYDSFSGEYDYEPGGLNDCKTHVILRTSAGDIESCNVELVTPVPELK